MSLIIPTQYKFGLEYMSFDKYVKKSLRKTVRFNKLAEKVKNTRLFVSYIALKNSQ